jgi:hypothetical protein
MFAPVLKRALAVLAVAPLAVAPLALAGAAPALASGAPGWRIVKTIGPDAGVTYMSSILATGRRDAWATAASCPAVCPGPASFLVEHWNGRRWKEVLPPAEQAAEGVVAVALGASSARNAWLFNSRPDNATALHWNGATWRKRAIPGWVVRLNLSGTYAVTPVLFGSADMWVFSLGQRSFSARTRYSAARYDGHRWTASPLPAIPDLVSAVSRNDIWVLGTPRNLTRTTVLMHWNGRSWRERSVPRAHVPHGASEFTPGILALGPRDVWLTRSIQKGLSGAETLYLLHWNGKSWRRVHPPFPTTEVEFMAPDGHGGIWMVNVGPKPAFRSYFVHLTGGHWTRQPVRPAKGTRLQEIEAITGVPGTASMWAVGQILPPHEGSGGIVGTIWGLGA